MKLTNKVNKVDLSNSTAADDFPSLLTERKNLKVVYVKDGIYDFGGRDNSRNPMMSVEKYSLVSKTWNNVSRMLRRLQKFCVRSCITFLS